MLVNGIPKRLGHIWVGPKPAPINWMRTWPELHPDWEYTVYDNDFLCSYPFRLRAHINEYFWRGLYAGVQDLMRYEILYEFGGFMADADAICRHRIDELLTHPRAYTVWDRPENDRFRAVCPILACEPGNRFVGRLIDRLLETDPSSLRKAEVSTGNRFLGGVLKQDQTPPEEVTIWPMHYFLPWHKSDPEKVYSGPDTVYAEQQYGTSLWAYNRGKGESIEKADQKTLSSRREGLISRLVGGQGRPQSPLRDLDQSRASTAHRAAEQARIKEDSPAFVADRTELSGAVLSSLNSARHEPRVHGLHYFRHMQNQPITQSKLKTRSAEIRSGLAGWVASAKRALVIGFDTGHLVLHAHILSPGTEIFALEGCRWYREKDKKPPQKHIYAPAAAEWLVARGNGQISARIGGEAHLLEELIQEGRQEDFDLALVTNADVRTLSLVPLLNKLLTEDAILVLAGESAEHALSHSKRLMLQRLTYAPFDCMESPSGGGSLAAQRIIPQTEACY